MFRYFSIVVALIYTLPSAITAQLCKLNAQYEEKTSRIILDWNMVSSPAKTTYVLLRSTDTKTWTEIVTGKVLKNYNEDDVFDYGDKINVDQKYFYRLKIMDINNKTITFSNIATVSAAAEKATWIIYPNPVSDILHLLYKGNNIIKGVINVTVQDITGKIIIRFRAASINKMLELPVNQLHKGIYIVQMIIMNEIVMNEKLFKQ